MSSTIPPHASNVQMPLSCNVCPKKPNFSDLSHLLTHIASKGHLSNYFKLKVKAGTDSHSKLTLDAYDAWYELWDVQGLLHDRMNQKERKKSIQSNSSRRGGTGTPNSHAGTTRRSDSVPLAIGLATRRVGLRRNGTVDPRLDRRTRNRQSARYEVPHTANSSNVSSSYTSMNSWSSTPYDHASVKDNIAGSGCTTPFEESSDDDEQEQYSYHEDFSNSSTSRLAEDASEEMTNEVSKLKGVYWTGMGLFDSATPEMRRKRNQKKAISVIQQLQATSELVEPTELVFDAEYNLRSERVITGSPDDEDHLPGETSPDEETPAKKKKPRKTREALQEKDANSGRLLRSNRASYNHAAASTTTGKRQRTLLDDDRDDDDDDLTYGRPQPKKRTGISVHRDNSGPNITFTRPLVQQNRSMPGEGSSIVPNPYRGQSLRHGSRAALSDSSTVIRNRRQHASSSFNAPGVFRPSTGHGTLPSASFSAFGQVSGFDSLLQASNYADHPFPAAHGASCLSTFSAPLNLGGYSSSYNHVDGMLSSNQRDHSHQTTAVTQPVWDTFGLNHQECAEQMNFGVLGEYPVANPLFFEGNEDALGDDDEATVSARSSPDDSHQN